jgi:hypothetical protein
MTGKKGRPEMKDVVDALRTIYIRYKHDLGSCYWAERCGEEASPVRQQTGCAKLAGLLSLNLIRDPVAGIQCSCSFY